MTTPTKPYHHGNLREALLDAAQELIAEHGAQALTLREVAKAAAVSHAAPYHHFDSLQALMAAVGERGFAMLAQQMSEAERSGTRRKAPKQRLLGICEAYVAFAQAHPETFRLMFGPLLARKREHPALQQAAERAFDVLLAAATDYAKSVDKAKEGPELALSGWSLAHGFAHLAIDGAFDSLPIVVPDRRTLARRLGERLLMDR